MALEKLFRARLERAASILSASQAGPKRISFTSAELSCPKALKNLHSQFPAETMGRQYLYQVTLENQDSQFVIHVRDTFRRIRASGDRNMSRDNSAHLDSNSIYVGTSMDMHSRFRSHLGAGRGKSTWGLYLSAWADQIDAKFVVEYYEFDGSVSGDVELIEGVLWDALQPLFGKKGGK